MGRRWRTLESINIGIPYCTSIGMGHTGWVDLLHLIWKRNGALFKMLRVAGKTKRGLYVVHDRSPTVL